MEIRNITSVQKLYLYHMRRMILTIVFLGMLAPAIAQQEDVATLHENAKKFMKQGDFANASLILVRAMERDQKNIGVAKDLALSFYMLGDNAKALSAIKSFLDKDNVDEQTYQIAGMIYKRTGDNKEAEKLYKKAIKNFPQSGPLYNDYGELLWNMKDYSSINQWEKGIKSDPSFPGNYYNAAKYYYLSQDKIWGLIYGEIFINIESHSARTAEIKNILLDGYKKLFSEPDLLADTKGKNKFEIAYLTCMNKQNSIVVRGIGPESLTMIRTRFLLNWDRNFAAKFPFVLFDIHKQLLENGLFEAYNQWIFGTAQNLSAFQHWISSHSEAYNAFNKYLSDRNLKFPDDQYYH